MKPEPTPPLATLGESRWVEGELVHSLVRNSRTSQLFGLILVPIVVGVLWNHTSQALLATWSIGILVVTAMRLWVMHRYTREVRRSDPVEQLAYFQRWSWLWPVNGFAWGAMTLLYFDRAPLTDQFICWLILAGVAMFSINSLSSHRRTLLAFVNAVSFTALAVVLWRAGFELKFRGPLYHYWIVLLLGTFWLVLWQAGLRQHVTQRRSYELQYRNNQLIETLRRQTQAALEAVEIKNRFLASAAHDLRQPVHALGLYADWLGSEPELVHVLAPKIVESTKAVNALFDSLFDLVRLDSGKIKLNIEPVDLNQLLHDLELQYRPIAQAKGLAFRLHVRSGKVVSDPILLRRIVGNLISNAIKYTPRGGVLVASRTRGHARVIEVWDTGLGIAPANQREIFREFYKVPNHPGTEEGFGLGLYIVARLSEILGHPISLDSRLGRGTVFRVELKPTDAGQAADRAAESAAQLASIP